MVEEASEFFKDIRLAVAERLTSPLIGAYWISWFILNFKFFLIIFSGENIDRKLVLIHQTLFPDPLGYAWTYGVPLIMTAAFIFIYPYPAEIVYKFRLQFQRRLTQIKQKIEDETLLSVEDARKLRLEIREKEQNFVTRLAEAEQQIDDLRRVNESLSARSGDQTNRAEKKPAKAPLTPAEIAGDQVVIIKPLNGLTAMETAVMTVIASNVPDTVSDDEIIRRVLEMHFSEADIKTRLRVLDAISSLMKKDFLNVENLDTPEMWYSLSKRGEEFALRNNL